MKCRVFYCCYETEDRQDLDELQEIDRDSIIDLALQILRSDGDFFGIVDEGGAALQFMVQADSNVWMEVPAPERRGSYGCTIRWGDVEGVLRDLNLPLGRGDLPGLSFQAW
ncbi:MAG: hypothetical protein H6833_07200 [Planctomycetes bacterium]|nr:hypothetical protein [Planctomycetota bacterium]